MTTTPTDLNALEADLLALTRGQGPDPLPCLPEGHTWSAVRSTDPETAQESLTVAVIPDGWERRPAVSVVFRDGTPGGGQARPVSAKPVRRPAGVVVVDLRARNQMPPRDALEAVVLFLAACGLDEGNVHAPDHLPGLGGRGKALGWERPRFASHVVVDGNRVDLDSEAVGPWRLLGAIFPVWVQSYAEALLFGSVGVSEEWAAVESEDRAWEGRLGLR